MQSIGNNFVAGFELFNILQRKMSLLSYGMRYQHKKNRFYAQYVAQADLLTLAYALQVQKRGQLISEFNYTGQSGETTSTIGFRQRFTQSEIISTINTKGKIGTVLNLLGMSY